MIYGTHPGVRDGGSHYGDFGDLHLVVEDTVKALAPHCHKFDSIVVRGVSGVVVGAPVALALSKPLVVVRKPNDNSHSSCQGREGKVLGLRCMGTRACFLDDLISTGNTRLAVQTAIAPEAAVVMQYTYKGGNLIEFPRDGLTKPPSFALQQQAYGEVSAFWDESRYIQTVDLLQQ